MSELLEPHIWEISVIAGLRSVGMTGLQGERLKAVPTMGAPRKAEPR